MQITEYIHALRIPFQIPIAPDKTLERFVYVYLVLGEEICLIDSGVQNADKLIFDYLKEQSRSPEEISLLLLTHAHPDHIGSAQAIKETTGCTVAAHPAAQAWIEDVEQQFKERPVPGFYNLVGTGTSVERLLQHGEIIDLGPVSLEVILTPGHAKGALSFFCREEGVLFSGDAVPQADSLPIYDDVAAAAASLKSLMGIEGLKYLLSSWSEPLAGQDIVTQVLDDSLAYLQRIHGAVRILAAKGQAEDPMALCARMVADLGLPDVAVNPLVARSFAAHLRVIDRETLC